MVTAGAILTWWIFCLPDKLFTDPCSTVVNDRHGELIGARIASDGQWRFPASDSVPQRFEKAILLFEDKRFYSHPGIDFRAIIRALKQNIQKGRVVSGASTITMQLMRMSRKNNSRSVWQKIIESLWALRAEFSFSKNQILNIYAANAPFGGNVVGLEAASWRYFNKPPHSLTWSEAAVLAALPNAPGLIYPGRNPEQLRERRNLLLEKLNTEGYINEETLHLAKLEKLPGTPLALPDIAPHLIEYASQHGYNGQRIITTLESDLQTDITQSLQRHIRWLKRNQIHHGAVLVADARNGEVLAYCGNITGSEQSNGHFNDMIQTPRSSGSILKPFLYASMLHQGILMPDQLIPDVPTQYPGFSPKNFDEQYSGAVPASAALARSLNVPAVHMLKEYGVPLFHSDLQKLGFGHITRSSSHYGLSLVLGGAETTLWELVDAYHIFPSKLNNPEKDTKKGLHYVKGQSIDDFEISYDAAVCSATTTALATVNRPGDEAPWETYDGATKVGWKTGTSHGFRDAWAVGFDSRYVVGIWVGNASGEGRPGITGLNAAAPLLFEVFNRLSDKEWFEDETNGMAEISVCSQSGLRASEKCELTHNVAVPERCLKGTACNLCQFIFTDQSGQWRINRSCSVDEEIIRKSWFILPPLQEWYYRKLNSSYKSLPPWKPGCKTDHAESAIQLIYPRQNSILFLPRELNGKRESVVLKAAHRIPSKTIYWHLDEKYLKSTSQIHQIEIVLVPGIYTLTLVDEDGTRLISTLTVSHAALQ